MRIILCTIFLFWLASCTPEKETLFENLGGRESGIEFTNKLKDEAGFDVFRYRNYYNGGGVGIADFNNDGLSDIYFISNQESNHLYINKGDFKFDRIEEAAGTKPWSTGVAIADVNGDGWQDIYVCNSGDLTGNDRGNELFINNQDGTFSERAEEYGLADAGFSTHAVFFDFDHDSDLDCYVLNNSFHPVSSLPIENTRDKRDQFGGGDKFYLNDGGTFKDVSDSVGVYGSVIGFGLGITLLDINEDGWTDLYISNDFFERDYLYINQEGKYFSEELESYFDQISLFSMGADAADLNNDGKDEIFVTDMLPSDRERLKKTTNFETPDLFRLKASKGFYNQFMKNTLQWNTGDGSFAELGRQKGVSASDWSWGALMFDMDNDGLREIFVANGVYKDVTDQDFIAYFASEENLKSALEGDEVSFENFVNRMPSTPVPNVTFKLDSTGNYSDISAAWGLATPSFSNGAAYGDLDNDGDYDLVVNNLNQPAFIYRNNSEKAGNSYIRIKLNGEGKNPYAIGAKVLVHSGEEVLSYNHYPVRGFQSSMDYTATLGLGNRQIDSVEVFWPGAGRSVYSSQPSNSTLEASIRDAVPYSRDSEVNPNLFKKQLTGISHEENPYDDFDFNRLVYHGLSKEGPALANGDINNDGIDDLYFGGSQGEAGSLWIGKEGFEFERLDLDILRTYSPSEDIDAVFFDADGDEDLDLYVVTGGVENSENRRKFLDRLYVNEGVNGWTESENIPRIPYSGSVVRPADFDNDGDIDLFLGGRSVPGEYGRNASSYLLENDGNGNFEEVSSKYMNQLANIGMVTDAVWTDYDNDDDLDIFIVGDWMPVILFENRGNFFQRKYDIPGLENSNGWWKSITSKDINGDGYEDLVIGNFGTNSMFKASADKPVRMYMNDYDENGSIDHVYTFKSGEKFVPYHIRESMNEQMVFLKKKFTSYAEYSDKSIDQIFDENQLQGSLRMDVYNLESWVAINDSGAGFKISPLPDIAQVSPIYEILFEDVNGDGSEELILMGNYSNVKPEEGVYDANHGVILSFRNGSWVPLRTGMYIRGDVRALRVLKDREGKALLIGKNDDEAEVYVY